MPSKSLKQILSSHAGATGVRKQGNKKYFLSTASSVTAMPLQQLLLLPPRVRAIALDPPIHEVPTTMALRHSARLSTVSSQSNILPMVTLGLKLSNFVLKLIEFLHFALARLTSSKGIPRSLHGNSIVRVLDNDRWKRLVALTRVDARNR